MPSARWRAPWRAGGECLLHPHRPTAPELAGATLPERTQRAGSASAQDRRGSGRDRQVRADGGSELADQADEPTLDVDLIWPEDACLVIGVGGLQCDRGAPLAQALERRLLLVNQRDHDVAVISGLAAAHYNDITVVDAGVDHGIPLHLQRKVLAVAHEVGRDGDVLRMVLNGADRYTGSDASHQRNAGRLAEEGRRLELCRTPASALDHTGVDPGSSLAA